MEEELAKQKQKEAKNLKQSKEKDWSNEEVAQLILAIKKFPPGTQNRWRVIAEFMNRNQKDVINKAKEMQEKKQSDVESKRKDELDRRQQEEKYKKEAQDRVKKQVEAKTGGQSADQAAANPDGWSNEQQKQMEKGMREVPSTVPTKERWIKIAEGVDGKTAKECFTRFKELCAKAKAAQN